MVRHRHGIYMIRNIKSSDPSDCYIGMSYQLDWRIAGHRRFILNGKHPNKNLNAAINRYGQDAFEVSILGLCDRWELPHQEDKWYWLMKPKYNAEKRINVLGLEVKRN